MMTFFVALTGLLIQVVGMTWIVVAVRRSIKKDLELDRAIRQHIETVIGILESLARENAPLREAVADLQEAVFGESR